MLCICSFLLQKSRGDAVPPGYVSGSGETGGDTPLAPARQGRLGTRVPRQRCKSPAELDFYGEFDAALCGAPVLPVLPKAKCGRRLAVRRAVRQKGHRPFSAFFKKVIVQDEAFTFYSHKKSGRLLPFWRRRGTPAKQKKPLPRRGEGAGC